MCLALYIKEASSSYPQRHVILVDMHLLNVTYHILRRPKSSQESPKDKISNISHRHISVSTLAFLSLVSFCCIINNSKTQKLQTTTIFLAHDSAGHQFEMGSA